jgi:hypothetical protein
MRKAYFLKLHMGNRYQHDQIGRVYAKSHDFHAISEIMRYSAGQEIHTEIEISNFNILGDNLRNCLVSYILRVIFRLGI